MTLKAKGWLVLVAALVCAGLAGFFTGRLTAPASSIRALQDGKALSFPSLRSERVRQRDSAKQENRTGSDAEASMEWSTRLADAFARAKPGEPTPEFATLFDEALQKLDPYSESYVMRLIESMRPEDLPQAFEMLKRLTIQRRLPGATAGGTRQSMAWQALWGRFGATDPLGAFRASRELAGVRFNGENLVEKHIFEGWTARDSTGAAQYFLAQPDMPNRKYAVQGITYPWARSDPQAAAEWVAQNLDNLDETSIRGHGFRGVAWALTEKNGFQTAVDWWKQLPDQTDRTEVFHALVDMSNGSSLDSRAALVTEAEQHGLRDPQFEARLASEFGRTQLSSPDNPAAYPALGTLLSEWTQRDPKAAAEWATDQQGQPWYDATAGSIAVAIQRSNPGAAAEWVQSIHDVALRKQIEQRLAQLAKRSP